MVTPENRRLDEAIDRAVRELVQLDPPPALRARVLSRLDGSSRRPAIWPRLAAAAAGLVIVIGWFLLREAPPDGQVAPAPQSAATSEPPAAVPAVPHPPEPGPAAVRPPTRAPAPPVAASRFDQPITAASLPEVATNGFARLEAIARIEFATIEPALVLPPPLEVTPMPALASVTVEPLPAPGGPN